MAAYDLEEQEQLEDLKAWWKLWGNTIAGVVIAVCVGVIGVQGWRWWTAQQAERASVLYNAVATAARANDVAKAKDAMTQLADKYGGTAYAARGALLLAATLHEAGDKAGAKAQLASVIDRDSEPELKEIARLRLAALLMDDKQYDEALRTLDAKHDEAFAGIYADIRGDILVAAGRNAEARTAYQTALARIDPKSPYRNYVQVKLDTLGGAAPAGNAPAANAANAPAAAAEGTGLQPAATGGSAAAASAGGSGGAAAATGGSSSPATASPAAGTAAPKK
jgi:predicted negative regulator of RcsB-dependent stress response